MSEDIVFTKADLLKGTGSSEDSFEIDFNSGDGLSLAIVLPRFVYKAPKIDANGRAEIVQTISGRLS